MPLVPLEPFLRSRSVKVKNGNRPKTSGVGKVASRLIRDAPSPIPGVPLEDDLETTVVSAIASERVGESAATPTPPESRAADPFDKVNKGGHRVEQFHEETLVAEDLRVSC